MSFFGLSKKQTSAAHSSFKQRIFGHKYYLIVLFHYDLFYDYRRHLKLLIPLGSPSPAVYFLTFRGAKHLIVCADFKVARKLGNLIGNPLEILAHTVKADGTVDTADMPENLVPRKEPGSVSSAFLCVEFGSVYRVPFRLIIPQSTV